MRKPCVSLVAAFACADKDGLQTVRLVAKQSQGDCLSKVEVL